ncbi:hypothetical protein M422DRAFT_258996 [Sphaerobolus stellatus SS14]|uniref:Uncharacterized protein n=1 Tax=Sphaerobolus stellatus (strain SS14) TaxID=990650 RepID=A0A0C9VKS0_SPHS4|nr:hypothetical protein M422DRAFT_258996 [Sphaerobolus stellatus SS14]
MAYYKIWMSYRRYMKKLERTIGRFGLLSFVTRGIEDLRKKPQRAEQDDPGTRTDKQEYGTLNL